MRNKNSILELQAEYLESHSTDVLNKLYDRLVGLCVTISTSKNGMIDREDCIELTEDIVMRLIRQDRPIIGSAPSSFISHAMNNRISVKNRSLKHPTIHLGDLADSVESTDPFCYSLSEDEEVEDRSGLIEWENHKELVDDVLANVEVSGVLRPVVEHCLYDLQPVAEVRKTLPSGSLRVRFSKTMKEVRDYVSENL